MDFRTWLKSINSDFIGICNKQKEVFINLDNFDKNEDVYLLLKELFDTDKNIRVQNSLSIDYVENALTELTEKTSKFKVDGNKRIFLERFASHIAYNIDLIRLLKKLQQVDKLAETTEERILYLLNFCTIAERSAYFQSLFIATLDELNKEIIGVNDASYNLFFRVGALNFKRHLYNEAIAQFGRAIAIMTNVSSDYYDNKSVVEQAGFRTLLFNAKIMRAVSYEFQGKFEDAIKLLIGDEDLKFIDTLTANDFLYSVCADDSQALSATDWALKATITPEQNEVVKNVYENIVQTLATSCPDNSCYKFALEADNWGKSLSDEEKEKIKYINNHEHDKYCHQKQHWEFFENDKTHEVLHILAHTINEQSVEKRRSSLLNNAADGEAEKISKRLILARALMLFIAKKQDFMLDCQKCLTCLATIYAEVGDYASAKAHLIETVNGNYYKNKDDTIRAEIEFFYYIVSQMENPNAKDKIRDQFYTNYKNFCYNHFDYDALAQIEMYSFKYSIISIFTDGKKVFNDEEKLASKLADKHDDFNNLVQTMQAVFVNDWTKNEYDKIKVMYQFLAKYYSTKKYCTDLSVIDLAARYLYLYAKSNKFRNSAFTPLYDLSNDESIIDFLNDIFSIKKQGEFGDSHSFQIRNCLYSDIHLLDIAEQQRMLNEMKQNSDNVCFVTVSDKISTKEVNKNFWIDSDKTQVLQHFLVNCALDSLLYDLVNPQNIFLLVPFVAAEPLAYQLNSYSDLLLDISPITQNEFQVKRPQRNMIVKNFIDNYFPPRVPDWVKKATNDFKLVEQIIWNDEIVGTVYSRERFHYFSCNGSVAMNYPLINHQSLIELFDSMINIEWIPCIHDNRYCGECRQLVMEYTDKRIEAINKCLCLPSLTTDKLFGKTIIVRYDRGNKQWRIVVLNTNVPDDVLKLLRAYICDNWEYVDENHEKIFSEHKKTCSKTELVISQKRHFAKNYTKQMEYASGVNT